MKATKPAVELNVNLKRVRRGVRSEVNTGKPDSITMCWTSGGGPRKAFEAL